MSQYDFGTIDPYVVDGVQLAGMLNQWRDAIHTWHRGATRPAYAVPGMMWINDSAGATGWVVNVYMGASVDAPLFTYNTSTGQITIAAGTGGFVANLITAQGTSPTHAWNKTDNAVDAKRWGMTVNAAGALVLSSLTDAGVIVQSFTFNRDGSTTRTATPGLVTATAGTHGNAVADNTVGTFTLMAGNTGSWLNLTTGRYTPPAGRFWLQCNGSIQAPSGGNGTASIKLRKNAAVVIGGPIASGQALFSLPLTLGAYVDANGTDYFDFVVAPLSTGLNSQTNYSFSAMPIS